MTEFRVGDEVFGIEGGANAEYVAVRESGVIAQKPTGLTFEEAAAVPDGSLLALTCLRPAYPLRGKSVLVYGAAGSVGTAAVQLLAHHFEAEVTAVCDTKDVELVRSLGARDVLDRLREDFTKNGETYDVIFDAVGKHSFRRCRRSLKPGGIYISMDLGFMYHVPLLALVTRFVGSRRATLGIGRYRKEDLVLVKELVEAGKYRPVIDRTYALDEVVEATRYVESGQKTGNVVLRVSEAAPASSLSPPRSTRRSPRSSPLLHARQPPQHLVEDAGTAAVIEGTERHRRRVGVVGVDKESRGIERKRLDRPASLSIMSPSSVAATSTRRSGHAYEPA